MPRRIVVTGGCWSAGGWAAYGLKPKEAGAWQELTLAKGKPSSSSNVDWRAITTISLRADAALRGAFTGNALFRDLRVEDI